jgi:hypothetical protein
VLEDERIPVVSLEVTIEGVLLAVLVDISVLIEDFCQNDAEKDRASSIAVPSGLAILIVAEKLTTATENAVDEEEARSLVVVPGLAILVATQRLPEEGSGTSVDDLGRHPFFCSGTQK